MHFQKNLFFWFFFFFYLSNHAVPLSIDVFSVPSIGHEVKVVGKTHNFCQSLEDVDAEAFAAMLQGPGSLHPQTGTTTWEREVTKVTAEIVASLNMLVRCLFAASTRVVGLSNTSVMLGRGKQTYVCSRGRQMKKQPFVRDWEWIDTDSLECVWVFWWCCARQGSRGMCCIIKT